MSKVLLITDRSLNNSLGRTAIHLEKGLNKHVECDLLVICSTKFFSTQPLPDKYLSMNINNFYINSFIGMKKRLKSLDLEQYDKIILTHQFLGYVIKPIRQIVKDVEIISFIHDIFPSLLFPKKISYKFLNHFYLKPIFKSNKFIFNSKHSQKTFREFYKLSNLKSIVCGVTISTEDFYKIDIESSEIKKKWNLPNVKTFLNVGICDWRKNVTILIKLAQKFPDYSFIKVGCLTKNEEREVKNLSNFYHFKNLKVEGIREMYNLSDIYLMPSFFEGFSITGFEALNCGTPVIGTFLSAHKEVYSDLVPFVYNPYDVDEYVKKIEELDEFSVNEPLLKERLDQYSIETISKKIADFILLEK